MYRTTAAGTLRANSDVDVAVEATGLGPWEFGGLQVELSQAVGRTVDLVDLNAAKDALLRFEVAKGQLLIGSLDDFVEFKCRAYREWHQVKPRFERVSQSLIKANAERVRKGADHDP